MSGLGLGLGLESSERIFIFNLKGQKPLFFES